MKKAASVISILFHPLLMPTLGLLVLLNSGSYVSLLDPAAKRAILFVLALGTLVFPLMMMPIFFYRNLVLNQKGTVMEERWIPRIIILILYIITCIYFMRLPLNRIIQGYVLAVTATLALLTLISIRVEISMHTAGPGGVAGLIIAMIILYGTQLEGFLLMALLAAGIVGTAKLLEGAHRPVEVYSGFLVGFVCVLTVLFLY
jgi:membrane-associated HD superfamily phosphohydrolase